MDEHWSVRNRVYFKLWPWTLKVDISCGNWNTCIISVQLAINEINFTGFKKKIFNKNKWISFQARLFLNTEINNPVLKVQNTLHEPG